MRGGKYTCGVSSRHLYLCARFDFTTHRPTVPVYTLLLPGHHRPKSVKYTHRVPMCRAHKLLNIYTRVCVLSILFLRVQRLADWRTKHTHKHTRWIAYTTCGCASDSIYRNYYYYILYRCATNRPCRDDTQPHCSHTHIQPVTSIHLLVSSLSHIHRAEHINAENKINNILV